MSMARVGTLTQRENNRVIHEIILEVQYYMCPRLILQKEVFHIMERLMNMMIKIGLFCLKLSVIQLGEGDFKVISNQ